MKTTYKRTWMYFKDAESKKEAIDFLLKLNVKFEAGLVGKWIKLAPSKFIKHDLDLYLAPDWHYTTFMYKF